MQRKRRSSNCTDNEVINSFKQNYILAWKDGWYIKNKILAPPDTHIARGWAARYSHTGLGISIPHWFIDFYPIKYDKKLEVNTNENTNENILSFRDNWERAWKAGWIIDNNSLKYKSHRNNISEVSYFYDDENKIFIPDYFVLYYPLKSFSSDSFFERKLLDNDEKNRLSFEKNWHKALIDGWYINNNCFLPPKGHEASEWTANFIDTKLGISIPHWFIRFYPYSGI